VCLVIAVATGTAKVSHVGGEKLFRAAIVNEEDVAAVCVNIGVSAGGCFRFSWNLRRDCFDFASFLVFGTGGLENCSFSNHCTT